MQIFNDMSQKCLKAHLINKSFGDTESSSFTNENVHTPSGLLFGVRTRPLGC